MFFGIGHSSMTSTLSLSISTSIPDIIWPKYLICFLPNSHFFLLAKNCCYHSAVNTCLRCSLWSSHVLLYINMSSKKTKMYFLREGLRIMFIMHWNVAGTLDKPKALPETHNGLGECRRLFSRCLPPSFVSGGIQLLSPPSKSRLPLQLIQKFFYYWYKELIRDCGSVQCPVINTEPLAFIPLLHQNNWVGVEAVTRSDDSHSQHLCHLLSYFRLQHVWVPIGPYIDRIHPSLMGIL